jgi:hypothetical protein
MRLLAKSRLVDPLFWLHRHCMLLLAEETALPLARLPAFGKTAMKRVVPKVDSVGACSFLETWTASGRV